MPSVTLGSGVAAIVARVLRSSMLETLRADYVTLARAKGAAERLVVLKHALRNTLIPTVTVVGLQVGVLLGGNMIVETVFSWPGLGRLVVAAIFARDFPLVQGTVMISSPSFGITLCRLLPGWSSFSTLRPRCWRPSSQCMIRYRAACAPVSYRRPSPPEAWRHIPWARMSRAATC
ncbi:MAG: ABC transporter permease [Anaerolineae bacterium]